MTKLGDICRFQSGGTPSKNISSYYGGSIPWITTIALNGSTITEKDAIAWITPTAISETAAKIVSAQSILVGTRVGIGKVAINTIPISTNQDILALIDIDENIWSKKYLIYAISAKKAYLNSVARGATIKGIKKEILENLEIKKIPLVKQQKISNILDKISNLYFIRKQQLSKLDQLVKSRFVEMFGDTKNNINNFKIYSIGDICSLKSGTSLPLNVENEGGDIPYIKVSDMSLPGNERYITISSRYVTQKTAGKGIFPIGSVIFPKRGGAIGTNKKRLTQIPICADLNIMGVIPGANITPYYLLSYFDMIDLGELDNGSSVPQLNNKDIAPLKILLPPLSLQEQFTAFVQQVEKAKSSVKQSLEKLETLKKSLMQEYFG